MIRSSLKLASCLVPVLAATPALATGSTLILDTTFANPLISGPVNATAVDSNGRILVGGNFSTAGGIARGNLARFNADGTLDATFGNPAIDGPVNAIVIDRNGKIIVAGSFENVGAQNRPGVARLNDNGQVDTSFAPTLNSSSFGLAIDSSDRILVAGQFTGTFGGDSRGLMRLDAATGARDTTLANPNIEVDFVSSPVIKASGVAVDSLGNIVVGGNFISVDASPTPITRNRIVRFSSTGALDTGFNPNLNGSVFAVAIDGNDKIVIGGDFTGIGSGPVFRHRLARLNSDGSADTSFLDPQISGGGVSALKIDASGRIVIGGVFTSAGGQSYARLARFSADGVVDQTFVPPAFTAGQTPQVNAISIDSSGRVIIGGIFATVAGQDRYHAARLTETFTLSVVKAGSGSVTSSAGGINCGGSCSGTVPGGTSVTLTATPDNGFVFGGWSGGCSAATAAVTFTVTADRSCTATFTTAPAPAPTPAPPPPPTSVSVPVDTSGSGQGTVSLAAALGNPGPNATITVQQESGAPLPGWLQFNPATLSFTYDVPLPADLPIQPAPAGDVRASRPAIPNRVYPLSVLVQTVPVLLTVSSGGATTTYSVGMSFYAPRSPSVMTAVSYSATGGSGNGVSGRPALSWDGGQILFETAANNLFVATSAFTKVARYHGLSGNRDLLSQTAIPGGGVANATDGPATAPAVSANGAWGVFAASGGG